MKQQYRKDNHSKHNQKRGEHTSNNKKIQYQKDRLEFVIDKRDWIKLSLIRQGNLCKRYSVIFTQKKKLGKIDKILTKIDIRKFNLTNMNNGIDLINKGTDKLTKGINGTFNVIDKTLESIGKVGLDSKKDPLKNLFGKNKYNVRF